MINCRTCGCHLARDHAGRECTPCAKQSVDRETPWHAPLPPDGFWRRDAVQAALADQHLGRVIRLYRNAFAPAINQADMADWLGVGQSQISRIETGRPPTDLTKLTRWAKALRVPGSLLWFGVSDARNASLSATAVHSLAPHGVHDRGDDDVHRRDVLKFAGAAVMSGAPWERLADTIERNRAPDSMIIGLMQDRTTEFFHLEETTPARTILTSLTEHGTTLRRLLNVTSNEQDRRLLLSAAGETEALTGWMAFDLSRPREALSRYRRALRMADDAGDGPLTACTLNYWSYLLASQDKSADAVELLRTAGDRVRGSAATTQAWVAGRQAEEAARVGDINIAENALARAFTAYDYARPHHERSWTSFFGASRLGSLAVSSYGRLGHRDTDALANSLLGSLAPTETKVRALVVADLALSAATNGDIDRADELAAKALPLAVRTEASLAQDRLWELTEALPQERGQGTVESLRKRVRSGLLAGDQG